MSSEKPDNQRWYWVWALLIVCLIFAGILGYIGWTITASNLGRAGASPGYAIAGELADARLRSMEQWCTGVVKTRSDVWLVSRNETRSSFDADHAAIPEDAVRLGESEGAGESRVFSSRSYLTTLARLQDDGQFRVEATVPDIACLAVTPESEHLYLFTWMRRPTDESAERAPAHQENRQHRVFRSTDSGQNWEWLAAGFMADTTQMGSELKPYFYSDTQVWNWLPDRSDATPRHTGADAQTSPLQPTSLFFSSNAGASSAPILSPKSLRVSDAEFLSLNGAALQGQVRRYSHDSERYVVQVNDTLAYAWESESSWVHGAQENDSQRVTLTTRLTLQRTDPASPWEVSKLDRLPGVFVAHLRTAANQRTHAVLHNDAGPWLVELDRETGEWKGPQPLPRLLPDSLVANDLSARYFWSNGDYQVVSLWGYVHIPRLLFPFTEEPAAITTDAHFYTQDNGRSWHQLAIPDYLGVMGLAHHDSQLFWTKGNWYSNEEPYVWSYDLAQ